jgi:hypothetical protein
MFWICHGDAPGSGGFDKDINELTKEGKLIVGGQAFDRRWRKNLWTAPSGNDGAGLN